MTTEGSAACESWGCDGSGRSKQGWSANYGDQYAPCGRRCETEDTDQATRGRAPADQHLARVRAEVRPTIDFVTEEQQ